MTVERKTENKRPVITVIMPSLNVAPYIQQCLESVCNQSLREIEILCVDAGSTDGTEELLKQFEERDARVRVIHSERKSYGYQMNLGLAAAQGDYIGIVETDDYVDADMFEKLYASAKEMNAEVVKANYFCHTDTGDNHFELFAGLPYGRVIQPKDYPSLIMRRPAIWSGIYKRSFLEENGIRFLETAGASFQDTSFILKVWISATRVCLMKQAYLHYRMDNPNSSVKSIEKIFYVREEMLAAHDYLEKHAGMKPYLEKAIWDCEAAVYEWNYNRLSKEMKSVFLSGVQERYREGLKNNRYERRFMRWPVWKMVIEVAEDPMIYLYLRLDRETWEQMVKEEQVSDELKNRCKEWAVKEKSMMIPQTVMDIINFAKYYGLEYCVRRVLKRQ